MIRTSILSVFVFFFLAASSWAQGPIITAVTPAVIPVGTPGVTLAITGSNFNSTAQVMLSGVPATTSFIDASHLNAYVPATLLSSVGTIAVTVQITLVSPAAQIVVSPSIVPTPSGADNSYCRKGDIPTFGVNDGPAKLPQACFYTGMDGTPSPNATYTMAPGQSLASVLSAAQCGDTILIPPTLTVDATKVTWPAKNCDNQHYITVRTSTSDKLLPPEGTRITPAWAGVASLPGRPAYRQPAGGAQRLIPKILVGSAGPMQMAGDHYRLIGLEITRPTGGRWVNNLLNLSRSTRIILDRIWIHGTAQDETAHGIRLNDASYAAIIDSYSNDFHCISSTGTCTDAQAISGGNDTIVGKAGVFKIVNNFIEAAGQSVLFGGGNNSVDSPADLEVRRNHMFKPWTWMPGVGASYVGGLDGHPFIVKNHFELKNAQRVLVEGNVMENVWGGFTQTGASWLLTPKCPISGSNCPNIVVADVTLRFNQVTSALQFLQIGNAVNDTGTYALGGGHNYSIHDNVVENINYTGGNGGSAAALLKMGGGQQFPQIAPFGIRVTHNTVIAVNPMNVLMSMGGPRPAAETGIVYVDNILTTGKWGLLSGSGSPSDCAAVGTNLGKMNACWVDYQFTGNVLMGSSTAGGAWPAGNYFPPDYAAIGFVNFKGGLGGDYHLGSSSPYLGRATDGKDPGADIDNVKLATQGVR